MMAGMSHPPPDPAGPPALLQRWDDLLFAHWEVDPTEVARRLPAGLEPDTFEGRAHVGVVAFAMRRVRPRGLPWVPWLSNFLELNVRLYVRGPGGRPGVHFLSLDCDRAPAVAIARARYHLPYEHATMARRGGGAAWEFRCRRRGQDDDATYGWRIRGEATPARAGTLDGFLAERYAFFAAGSDGRLRVGEVRHEPYRLAPVELTASSDLPLRWNGLGPAGGIIHAMASPGVAVRCWNVTDARLRPGASAVS